MILSAPFLAHLYINKSGHFPEVEGVTWYPISPLISRRSLKLVKESLPSTYPWHFGPPHNKKDSLALFFDVFIDNIAAAIAANCDGSILVGTENLNICLP